MANRVYPYLKTTAPGAGDDTSAGYKVGDTWLDTTNDKIYQAIDVSAGAAIWIQLFGNNAASVHTHASNSQGGNTLTTPTIASFTNAQHDHSNAAGGGAIPVFKTIAVSGQSDVVADSVTDTLTLAAGDSELEGETLLDGETLGLTDDDGETLALGLTEADGLRLGLLDELGLTDGLTELEGLALLEGETEADGLTDADGETEAEGETEGETDELGEPAAAAPGTIRGGPP